MKTILIFFLLFFTPQSFSQTKLVPKPGSSAGSTGGGSGTVTSVGMTVPSFLSVSGSPVTTSGTLALTFSGTAIPVLNGGTGATSANSAFNNLAPSQAANSGKFLTTDGTNTSWATISSGGANTALSNLVTTAVNETLNMAATKTVVLKNEVNLLGRNAADNANIPLIKADNSDGVTIGDGGIPVTIGGDYISLVGTSGAGITSFTNFIDFYGDLGTGTTGVELNLFDGDGSNFVAIKAPDVIAVDQIYEWPATVGTAGQVLTDAAGDGVLSWTTPGGGGGATTALDNLVSTAVNAPIVPDSDDDTNLGSSSFRWNTVYGTTFTAGSATTTVSGNAVNLNSTTGFVSVNSNGNGLALNGSGTAASPILFNNGDNSFATYIKSPDALAANLTLILPTTAASAGEVLTDVAGDGVLSWETPSASVSFPLTAPDGTAGAPSYSFSGSTDSGMYAAGSSIGIAADGTTIGVFASSGGLRFTPSTNGTINLGSSAEPWDDFFTKDVFIRYGELRFYDLDLSNYISFYPATTISTNVAFQLPTADGAASTALITNGSGTLSFGIPNSPQGTVCGWYDVGTTTLISSCKGSDPNTACPSGYTQRTTAATIFCTAN